MGKYKINDLSIDPPGGWRWECEKHGTRLKANTFVELLSKVNAYLRANGIEVHGDRVAWLQNQMCYQNNWEEPICSKV